MSKKYKMQYKVQQNIQADTGGKLIHQSRTLYYIFHTANTRLKIYNVYIVHFSIQ